MTLKPVLILFITALIGVGIFLALQKDLVPPREDAEPSVETPVTEEPTVEESKVEKPEACIQLYDPVCGVDGKTYSNSCFAAMAEMEVAHKGECSKLPQDLGDCKPPLQCPPQLPGRETPEVPQNVMVSITDAGSFAPQTVQVKKGGTVTWVNQSTHPVWPASGVHPTHTIYPGFDALRRIQPGEKYSFKFDRVGVWEYHDHLNALMTGTVEVIE